MKTYNVLVTGVGAIIGYGIINSLKKCKFDVNIIGMDIYNDAVGRFWCDTFVQAMPATDENYIKFLKGIISAYKIDLVFFGTEQEAYRINDFRDECEDIINKIVLNNKVVLDLSKDKWKMHQCLIKNNISAIPSRISGDFIEISKEYGIPFLLKPRSSYASKGIVYVDNIIDFNYFKEKQGSQFMAQKIIGDKDHEYTSSVFGFGNGDCTEPIILKRKLSQEGSTVKANIVVIPDLQVEIFKYIRIFKPIGPTNLQFREENGVFYLLEINPRISSATSIRTLFGFNEAQMCLEYFLENKLPSFCVANSGTVIRFIEDLEIK